MRELKFRIWSPNQKKYFYADEYIGVNQEYGVCCFGMEESYDKLFKIDDEANTIIMQYTGLKDKNGKEIYEGDIVKTIPYHKEKPEIKVIKWELLPKCGGCPYQEWGIGFNLGEYALDHLEVISNIYENTELLEVKNE